MGVLTRAFSGGDARALGKGSTAWILQALGEPSVSGISITHGSALTISAVFACVRVLSETLASLPLHLYERRPDGGKTRAAAHALYPVLHDMANSEMTSFVFRETLQAHLATWGNGYAEIESNTRGEIVGLWPLRPDKTRPIRIEGALWYETEIPNGASWTQIRLPARRVFHVPGPGFDGLQGYSMISLFRDSMGLAKSTERYGNIFFRNGARPGVVLKHPGKLNEDAQERLKNSWQDYHQGLEKAHRLAILEEGMDLETIGIPPDEAQFLATRKFQVTEIARIFRVPPHLIGDLERATFSNIEHQGIEFVVHTMRPWLVRWEQEIGRQLLTAPERARYYAEFLVDALLRGDIQSRYSAYSTGRQNGWLSANDVRRLENMDPLGPEGDIYMVPLNMIPAEQVAAVPPSTEDQRAALSNGETRAALGPGAEYRAAGLGRHRLAAVWRRQYAEAAGRLVRRETNDVLNAARRFAKADQVAKFQWWLDDFYTEFESVAAGTMRPVAWSYGEMIAAEVAGELGQRAAALGEHRAENGDPGWAPWAQRYIEGFGSRYTSKSKTAINEIVRRAIEAGEPWIVALEEDFNERREVEPERIANEEAVRFGNGLATFLYTAAGIARVRWLTINDSCPYCKTLNGRTIRLGEAFLSKGQPLEAAGGMDRPLTTGTTVRHPPAHRGCDCVVVASS